MIYLILFLIFVLAMLGIGALGALSDIRILKIPNIYSVIIAVAFPVCFLLMWLAGVNDIFLVWWSHLGAAAIVLILSAALFFLGVMGAADSKLASAYALWIGLGNLPVFLFIMSLVGAILGMVAIYIKKKKPFKSPLEGGWIYQLQNGGSKVPYGVAIVIGAIFGFYHVGYLKFENLATAFGI